MVLLEAPVEALIKLEGESRRAAGDVIITESPGERERRSAVAGG